ncbi:Protein of unknown function [Saccharopolyspora antimicrobica]|uniref:Uncharacterized protein DUF3631 n=1 Tax=Saccharopolyspora antimicrobica TaxID=455193 RepID=A0A1I4QC57_9PSEU|nr:DUF3631 domain-containing protein [Saccharopolyspora antimicrobica]RKT84855.1 uncharacterized protein DUF3631 [Saccharopolyspora antimicrobica]SFM37295.1 Protein of unknown function [Saccharopolyspora antimicrobica]
MTPQPADAHQGAALLNELHAALTRYVILPTPQAVDAVTLWIAATHAQPAWAHAPRLVIRAPEKRCGKSRLLDVVEATCHEPFITVNASPSAVYRSITEDPPTMLVDEADTIFGPDAGNNEDLRGLLNAGHQRNRPAKRYDAAAGRVESIPTFAMAALAGIGAMPDTIEDRAVIVRMRRRAPGETVAPYRIRRDRPVLASIAQRLERWLRADLAALEAAEPAMPVEDRAADTWEPLIIVADHAGDDWPHRARQAAVDLLAEAAGGDQGSVRTRLLVDCRTAFSGQAAISTAELLNKLNADPESPWPSYGKTGLNAAKLSKLLGEFDIRSGNVRFPDGSQAKGYRASDFHDAWTRYCPADEGKPSQPSQASPPSSARDGLTLWDGTSRPTNSSRPALTCIGTDGTAGTATPPITNTKGVA